MTSTSKHFKGAMMKRLLSLFLLGLTGCSGNSDDPKIEVVEWEHGYKTKYVVATRYKNPSIGYNIAFTFPEHAHNSDRVETFAFLSANGCGVFQGGGYPGAPLYAACESVVDRTSANKKLMDLLPKLDTHIRSLD